MLMKERMRWSVVFVFIGLIIGVTFMHRLKKSNASICIYTSLARHSCLIHINFLFQSSLGVYSFLPFVVMLLGFLIFTVAFVPETKGKRIEDITLLFKTSASNESSKVDLTYRQISEDVSSSVQSSGRWTI